VPRIREASSQDREDILQKQTRKLSADPEDRISGRRVACKAPESGPRRCRLGGSPEPNRVLAVKRLGYKCYRWPFGKKDSDQFSE